MNLYELAKMSADEKSRLLRRSEPDIERLQEVVRPIVREVRERGDAALVDYAREFDNVELSVADLKVSEAEFAEAEATLEPEIKLVIDASARNIRTYHEAQKPEEMWFTRIDDGIMAGEKITPIASVGLYVPRGKGAFPSVMLMLAVPAMIAEVPRVGVCTPPGPDGEVDNATLYAASVCGITEVYKAGGAQAIAALAFGTATVPKVNKIVGPGSGYVAAAKRLLYGTVDVGIPAGPSESIILCDEHTDSWTAALDLLIEAEHGPDSTALLVTHSSDLAGGVEAIVPDLLRDLPAQRREFCRSVLDGYGGVVLTESLEESIQFVNDFAPEHLEILVREPMAVLPKIVNAGEILLGPHTPITLGNYCLGVNAILPTGGLAKTYSCVTIYDFLKRSSIGYVTREGYDRLKDIARTFAEHEGFAAHANAIARRNPD